MATLLIAEYKRQSQASRASGQEQPKSMPPLLDTNILALDRPSDRCVTVQTNISATAAPSSSSVLIKAIQHADKELYPEGKRRPARVTEWRKQINEKLKSEGAVSWVISASTYKRAGIKLPLRKARQKRDPEAP